MTDATLWKYLSTRIVNYEIRCLILWFRPIWYISPLIPIDKYYHLGHPVHCRNIQHTTWPWAVTGPSKAYPKSTHSRVACCLLGAWIRDVTETLPSLIQSTDYYSLLLLHVGTSGIRSIKEDCRALRVRVRDWRAGRFFNQSSWSKGRCLKGPVESSTSTNSYRSGATASDSSA